MKDLGASSGSREPDPSCTGSGPSGFDPARMAGLIEALAKECEHQAAQHIATAHEGLTGWSVDMWEIDCALAKMDRAVRLREMLGIAIAAAARQGGDAKQAPGEAPQSGPKGIAQKEASNG